MAAVSDLQRVANLYEQTRQKSTIMFVTKSVQDQLKEANDKVGAVKIAIDNVTSGAANDLETNAATEAANKKQIAKLNAVIKKKEIMIEYLQVLTTKTLPEGNDHMVWIREPKVYALTPVGLQGIGYSKKDNKIALRGPAGEESLLGTTFSDLGLNGHVLLFARDFVNDKEVGGIFIADPSNRSVGSVIRNPEDASLLLRLLPAPKVDPEQVPVAGSYWETLGGGVKTGPESEVFFTEDQCVTKIGGEWRSFAEWMGGRYEVFYDDKGTELGFCFKDGFSISYDAGPGNREAGGPPEAPASAEEQPVISKMKLANETSLAAAASFANAEGFKEKLELTSAINSYNDAISRYNNAIELYTAILADVESLEESKRAKYTTEIKDLINDLTKTRDSIGPLINELQRNEVPPATADQQAMTLEAEGGTLETQADQYKDDVYDMYVSYKNDPSASSLTVDYIESRTAAIINEYNNAASKYQDATKLTTDMNKMTLLQAKIDMIKNEKIPLVQNSGKEVIDMIKATVTPFTDPTAELDVIEGGKLEKVADEDQTKAVANYNLYQTSPPDSSMLSDTETKLQSDVRNIIDNYQSAINSYTAAINKYKSLDSTDTRIATRISEIQAIYDGASTKLDNAQSALDVAVPKIQAASSYAAQVAAANAAARQAAANAAAQAAANAAAQATSQQAIQDQQAADQAAAQDQQAIQDQAAAANAADQLEDQAAAAQAAAAQAVAQAADTGAVTGADTGAVTGADTGATTWTTTGDSGDSGDSGADSGASGALGDISSGEYSEGTADNDQANAEATYSTYQNLNPTERKVKSWTEVDIIRSNQNRIITKYNDAIGVYQKAIDQYKAPLLTGATLDPAVITRIAEIQTKLDNITQTKMPRVQNTADAAVSFLEAFTGGRRHSRKQRK